MGKALYQKGFAIYREVMLYQAPHFPAAPSKRTTSVLGCVAVRLWGSAPLSVGQPGGVPTWHSPLPAQAPSSGGGRRPAPDLPRRETSLQPLCFNLHVKNKRNPEVERTHQERATDERVGKSCA